MAVTVETYEIEEALTPGGSTEEIEEAAVELISKLGLTGQGRLVSSRSDGEAPDRMPYAVMTGQERAVYEALFPQKTKVENYAEGIIPLRVLQVIGFCRDGNFFRRMEVWHRKVRDTDPLLVGWMPHPNRSWDEVPCLLARWGTDALRPFSALVAEARESLSRKFETACHEAAGRLRALADGGWRALVERRLEGNNDVSVPGADLS